MALSQIPLFACATAFFGMLAFILDVFAELKKPPFGTPVPEKGVIICKFPVDPSIALGAMSIVAMLISVALGIVSIFFPYKGKPISKKVLFQDTLLIVFFNLSLVISIAGAGMTLWATFSESLHRIHNVHDDLRTTCPTAKTGLFGGAAFLHLDASLLWLICMMLALNIREDHFHHHEGLEVDFTNNRHLRARS
ncbi:uncharacterized protein [Typha angustifolia]|uniref:uncharacterized protein n=1 Tax=Typha angustifolia TaxID=59011 RepID=UPI003C3065D5